MSVAQHFQHPASSLNEHEMETDAHPEDNLDVDIDLGDGVSHVGTDDYMHDDDVQQRLAEANDDDMVDDLDYQQDDADGMMQDDQGVRNEELFDAGLDAEGDTELVEAVIDSYEGTTHAYEGETVVEIQDDAANIEQLGTGDVNQQSVVDACDHDAATNAHSVDRINNGLPTAAPDHEVDALVEENIDETDTIETAQQNDDTFTVDDYYATNSGEIEGDVVSNVIAEQAPSIKRHHSSATNLQHQEPLTISHTSQHDEQPSIATTDDPAPPPVIVFFQDSELYLFSTPDRDPSVCLLEDDTLFHSNLHDLLFACRIMLNEHVNEGEMLEMYIEALGLTFSETSCDAKLYSIAEILAIFVRLLLNDGPPVSTALYIAITTKPSFSTRMRILSEAVATGRGLTEVHAELVSHEGHESEDLANDETPVEDVVAPEDELESAYAANGNLHDGSQQLDEHAQPALPEVSAETEAEEYGSHDDTATSTTHVNQDEEIEADDQNLLNHNDEEDGFQTGEDFHEEEPQEEVVAEEGDDGVELETEEQEQIENEDLYQEFPEEAEVGDGQAGEEDNGEENEQGQYVEQNEDVNGNNNLDAVEDDDLDPVAAVPEPAQKLTTNGHDLESERNEGALNELEVPYESTNGDDKDDYNDDLDFDENNIDEEGIEVVPDEAPATIESAHPVLTRKRSRLEDEEEKGTPAKKQQLA